MKRHTLTRLQNLLDKLDGKTQSETNMLVKEILWLLLDLAKNSAQEEEV